MLLKNVRIKNFKCFREKELRFDLGKSTYLIGSNNSGKTAVLLAIKCFFDTDFYNSDFLNKTFFLSKKEGYNKSVIGIEFDLKYISNNKTLRSELMKEYGDSLIITKSFTFRDVSKNIVIEYAIKNKSYEYEELEENIRKFLSKISVSYIHPQEADELLKNAQEKLKNRLLSNWGRRSPITDKLSDLRKNWQEVRDKSNSYLSKSLTTNIQKIWPGSTASVDLPLKIEDIISIAQINFKGSDTLPQVSLSYQGTGAQSTILYQTHFLLDSDRTLHKGFYYPIWLLEEPESFLHADITFKLGQLLNSNLWLSNIQMVVSTHSPLLLATSKINQDKILWDLLENQGLSKSKLASEWSLSEIKEIGTLMGDSNFEVYFDTSMDEEILFVEDKRELTMKKWVEAGFKNVKMLQGYTNILRYLEVIRGMGIKFDYKFHFIVDHDNTIKNFKEYTVENLKCGEVEGFKKFEVRENVWLIVLPENHSVEDLFDEYANHLEECSRQMVDENLKVKATIPHQLSSTCTKIKHNTTLTSLDDVKSYIKNEQEVKDLFWKKVEKDALKFSPKKIESIKKLVENVE